MNVAVAGATGRLGSRVVDALLARGHAVALLSRTPPKKPPPGTRHHPVDLRDGSGLDAAVRGADAVVDAANGPANAKSAAVLVDGTRRLLAAEAAAGVSHHVAVSIVGCERVPMAYYQTKATQENVVRAGAVPWSIVRGTQFHELLAWVFAACAGYGVLPAPGGVLQPVDAGAVAELVAETVERNPVRGCADVVGPEVATLHDLARQWKAARRSRALILRVPTPPTLHRALRDGALTAPSAERRGTMTFDAWLKENNDAGNA